MSPDVKEGNRIYLPQRFSLTSTAAESNDDFWLRVADAIDARYGDLRGQKVYLHGDAAPWIKAGLGWIVGSEFVLDRFHVMKHARAVSGGNPEYFNHLWTAVQEDKLPTLRALTEAISRLRVHCLNGGMITGDDLRKPKRLGAVGKRMQRRIEKMQKDYQAYPLPSELFATSRRGTSMYTLFEAMKRGGAF